MKRIHRSLGLLALLLATAPASAQGFVFSNPNGFDYGIAGTSITFSQRRHQSSYSITIGSVGVSAYGTLVPAVIGPPIVIQPLTIVTYRPAPPPVVVPSPFVMDDLTLAILPRREPEIPLTPRPLPERKPQPAPDAPKKPMQPELAPPPKPEPAKPQPKPADLPRILPPNPDPRAENALLTEWGKEAFADTDYGLAAQRFRQATVVLPNDPQAHFLLAQALFCLAKYQEAVDAIDFGMGLQPNWPVTKFRPLDLYGAHVALYPEQLRRLEDVVKRFPNDPVVLFLFGYELWFDGRKDEARGLFRKALAAGADPIVIDRFLRAPPPGGGL